MSCSVSVFVCLGCGLGRSLVFLFSSCYPILLPCALCFSTLFSSTFLLLLSAFSLVTRSSPISPYCSLLPTVFSSCCSSCVQCFHVFSSPFLPLCSLVFLFLPVLSLSVSVSSVISAGVSCVRFFVLCSSTCPVSFRASSPSLLCLNFCPRNCKSRVDAVTRTPPDLFFVHFPASFPHHDLGHGSRSASCSILPLRLM